MAQPHPPDFVKKVIAVDGSVGLYPADANGGNHYHSK